MIDTQIMSISVNSCAIFSAKLLVRNYNMQKYRKWVVTGNILERVYNGLWKTTEFVHVAILRLKHCHQESVQKQCVVVTLKAGCSVFQRRLYWQVFSPKPWIKFRADPSCRFREKRKNDALQFWKNDVTEPKARLL